MDAAALRAEFPVLERLAFLNAGTDGPVPAAAVRAARGALESQLAAGRYSPHFDARFALQAELRELYASVVGCAVEDLSLQTSTSEGLGDGAGRARPRARATRSSPPTASTPG